MKFYLMSTVLHETRQLPVTVINDVHCMIVLETENSLLVLHDGSHSETAPLKDETPVNIIMHCK